MQSFHRIKGTGDAVLLVAWAVEDGARCKHVAGNASGNHSCCRCVLYDFRGVADWRAVILVAGSRVVGLRGGDESLGTM